ncbi:MAG: hypothetical protein NUV73_02490 [Candidatus Daviesbacteria bacterium]|nr:hypothetical protein [Candidatus Daviesbacteria bacterium]
MPKLTLLIIALTVIIATALVTLILNNTALKTTSKSEIDTAVNQAQHVYRQRKAVGEDFSVGPCLSDALMPGWVADIAHSPRLPADDLPENQCPAYREGRAEHFVELDPDGNLIRAR